MKRKRFEYDSAGDKTWITLMKRKFHDTYKLEIISRRKTQNRSVGKHNTVDKDYMIFIENVFLKDEPCCSFNEDDDDSEEDPHYKLFLKNLKADRLSYKLEIPKGNETITVMYEEDNDSDDNCMLVNPIKSKKVPNEKYVVNEENQLRGNVKAAKYVGLGLSRTRNSSRVYNNVIDSRENKRNRKERELQNFVKKDDKSKSQRAAKIPRSGVLKHVEGTDMDMYDNRGIKGRNLVKKKEKEMKTKPRSKRSRTTRDIVIGCNSTYELNAGDMDVNYLDFLVSVGNYDVEGQRLLEYDHLDVECFADPDVFVSSNPSDFNERGLNPFQTRKLYLTPENEQPCRITNGQGVESVFRKKLMAKLREPYDETEYKELWDEIHKEKPKVKHHELHSGEKSCPVDELGPSYLATYARGDVDSEPQSHFGNEFALRKKVEAVRNDSYKKLKFFRAFFFWLQNVAHEDAFQPWFDKSCLEEIHRKS